MSAVYCSMRLAVVAVRHVGGLNFDQEVELVLGTRRLCKFIFERDFSTFADFMVLG